MFLEVNDPIFLEVYGYGPIDGKILLVVCLNQKCTVKVKNVNVRHHTCVLHGHPPQVGKK